MGDEKLSSTLTHSFFQDTSLPTPSFTTYKLIPNTPSIGRAFVLIHNIISTSLLSPDINIKNSASILHYKLAYLVMSTPKTKLTSFNITSLIYNRLILLLSGKISELLELNKALVTPTPHFLLNHDAHESNKLKTATSLAQQGHFSKALATIVPELPLADPSDSATKALLNQHYSLSTPLPDAIPITATPGPKLSRELIEKAIRRTRTVSAAGRSGWRPSWYKDLLRFGISSSITHIINSALTDPTSPLIPQLRLRRCIALQKNPSAIRPINIQEAITRLISRSIELSIKSPNKNLLHQYAIKNPNGISQIPWFLKLLRNRHPDAFIASLDISNAFGSVNRTYLAQQLTKFANDSLNSYFNIMYTHTINTMTSNGDIYNISTGVLQGDPLGTFLFSLALQPSLDHMSSDTFKSNLNIFAYVDDIYLFGEYEHLLHAISSLTAHLSEGPGLSINHSKCSFYPMPDSPPVDSPFPFVDSLVILGTPLGSVEFIHHFVSNAIEKSRVKLDAITKLESLQLQLLLVRFCITPTITHLTRTVNPHLLHDLTDKHHANILQFLKRAISLDDINDTFSESIQYQASLPLDLGGLGLTNTTYVAPAHHLGSFQCCSSQLATKYGSHFTDLYNYFVSPTEHAQDDLQPLLATIDMFSQVCNPTDPTRNTLNIHDLHFEKPRSLVQEYVASTNHIVHQLLLDNFIHMDDDIKHTPRRNLIRLKSLTAGHGALAYLQAIPTHKKLTIPNDLLIIAVRRTLGLPLLSPHVANYNCFCSKPNDELHLEHCKNASPIRRHNSIRDEFKSWLDYLHIYNVKEEQLDTPGHAIDLTTTHPSDDNAYRYFDFTIRSTAKLADIDSTSPINPNAALLNAIEAKKQLYLPILSNFKPPGFIFQALAFNTHGAAHQDVRAFLTELSAKAQSRTPIPTAFNANNFLSYATQRLSILVNIGTAEIIKKARGFSDPFTAAAYS